MREHGLIMPNRTKSWLAKYNEAIRLKCSNNKASAGRFVAFMQITQAMTFDRIVEGLQLEHDLRKFLAKLVLFRLSFSSDGIIPFNMLQLFVMQNPNHLTHFSLVCYCHLLNRLHELRSNGITTFQGGRIYHKLRAQRMSKVRTKNTFNWEWKHLVPSGSIDLQLSASDQILKHCQNLQQMPTKRKSTPLNIIGLPNFDKLNADEKELCSRIRVIPDAYLTYKKLLVAENGKMGYLRLADARRLIKIDVNKTRVMYDFFVEHGFVNKPFDK